MLLLEAEGKAIFREYGIACPPGRFVDDERDLDELTAGTLFPVVLKAQVAAGSRGKRGGILYADDAESARDGFARLRRGTFGGLPVRGVLVEQRVTILAERYLSALVHDGEVHLMACARGGIEIESIAAERPTEVMLLGAAAIRANRGTLTAGLRAVGFPSRSMNDYVAIAEKLCRILVECDATLAEINPLAEVEDGRVLALDARIDIDAAALPRQAALLERIGVLPNVGVDKRKEEFPEIVSLTPGGRIGLVGLGGGLNLCIVDWLQDLGAPVAVLTDMDDAIASGKLTRFLQSCVSTMRDRHGVDRLLINAISASYPLDDVARSIIAALDTLPSRSRTLCAINLQGRRGAEAADVFREADRIFCSSLGDAVRMISRRATD